MFISSASSVRVEIPAMQTNHRSKCASSLCLQETIALRNLGARSSTSTAQVPFILLSGPNLREQGCIPEPFRAVWKVGASLFTKLWKEVSMLCSKEGREAHWFFALLPTSSQLYSLYCKSIVWYIVMYLTVYVVIDSVCIYIYHLI